MDHVGTWDLGNWGARGVRGGLHRRGRQCSNEVVWVGDHALQVSPGLSLDRWLRIMLLGQTGNLTDEILVKYSGDTSKHL